MTTISNKNIIIGTGRLGRNEGYIEDSKRLQTIDYMLSKFDKFFVKFNLQPLK